DGFEYFLAFSIMGALSMYINTSYSLLTVLEVAIVVGITIWGSYLIFKTNSEGDRKDFFKRYFALAWVISFRLFIFTMIATFFISILLLTFGSKGGGVNSYVTDIFMMIIVSLFGLVYYLLLNNSFRKVSSRSVQQPIA
ncbi:MAG: hypothetical protein ABJC55_13640, partial [Algoriphagus sp.]